MLSDSNVSGSFVHLVGILLLVGTLVTSAVGADFAWGHITKYASTLYERDVTLEGGRGRKSSVVDVAYPEPGEVNDYTIIGVFALDMNSPPNDNERNVTVRVLSGGVGHKYAKLRFEANTKSYGLTAYAIIYKLIIYGVDL